MPVTVAMILVLNVLCLMVAIYLGIRDHRSERFKVAVTVVSAQLLFIAVNHFVGIDDPFAYYALAALGDLAVIVALSNVSHSRISLDVQLISFASILINATGYVAYELYVSSVYYNLALCAVLAVLVFRLLTGPEDERHSENRSLRDLVRRLDLLGCASVGEHQAKTETTGRSEGRGYRG